MDLSKFFDTVNHDVLMHRVSRKIHDKRVLRLIGKYLRAGAMVNGRLQYTRKGVPQGGPLSPLLSNILLDDLDKELERRGHRFVRYADDFIILVKSQRAGERVMASITRFLERKLKLRINETKSLVAPVDRITFLGFIFKKGKIRWSDKSFREFKRRVKRYTGPANGGICINDLPFKEACAVYSWLDELLWNLGVLSPHSNIRSLATKTSTTP